MKEKRKRWKYNNAQIGEKVVVKKDPINVTGLKDQAGEIYHIFPKEIGIQIKFFSPVSIKFSGHDPQTVISFTLKTSYLSY